jgi:uncharacterized protein YjbJ (UPF0337 family)
MPGWKEFSLLRAFRVGCAARQVPDGSSSLFAINWRRRMNWTIAENNWNQFKGRIRARWIQLNEEQLAVIAGKRPELLKSIQSTYGLSRAEAEREVRAFEARNKDYRPK